MKFFLNTNPRWEPTLFLCVIFLRFCFSLTLSHRIVPEIFLLLFILKKKKKKKHD